MSRRQQRRMGAKDFAVASKSSFDSDWRDTKTAAQCLSHLCLSDHLSDITFTFKGHKNVQLSAHKFVLSMRSSVFEAMFHGPMAEDGQTVTIEDIEPETMKTLLRFAYSDSPKLDGNNVLRCLYAAKKYALSGLIKKCSEFLENNLDPSNVCAIHEQAVVYDMKSLETKCFDFILENTSDVFVSQGFLEVSHATLLKLLKHDELTEDEVNVFNAAIKWSQNYCKSKKVASDSNQMRKSLGEALFAIRFPIMPIAEFAKVVTPTGILTSEEQLMLYPYIATEGSTQLNKFTARERPGKVVTIDVSTFSHTSKYQYYGCHLQIDDQEYQSFCLDWEEENQTEKTRNLKIKSVTGTFVKNVKAISLQNTGNISSYRIKGNRLLFRNPIEITDGGVYLSFSTEDATSTPSRQDSSAMSGNTQIDKKVNDRIIRISQTPVGMKTISFVK